MPSSPFPAVILTLCSLMPAMALELADLHLPMTRDEADKVLSRDYNFSVMADMTVRRSWELKGRTVSVDFSPKEDDKALLIFIDYHQPVAADIAHADAAQMLGMEPGKWQSVNQKRALRLGMESAEGFKLSGARYCFRELDERGQVVKLAYYASAPKDVRWDLAKDTRDSGKTAMGSRSASGSSEFLWKDEERRRGVSANSSAASLATAAAAVVADVPGGAAPAKQTDMIPRPADEVGMVEKITQFIANMTPTQYAIGAAVLALLMLMRLFSRLREARRRAMVEAILRGDAAERRRKGKP